MKKPLSSQNNSLACILEAEIGLIAKHLSVFTQRCHIIMHLVVGVPISHSASLFVGHVEKRVTHRQDMSPDRVFGFS